VPAPYGVDLCNEMGRRLVPPPTAVPIATEEEPWRERPRESLRAVAPRRLRGSFTPRFPVIIFDVCCRLCFLVAAAKTMARSSRTCSRRYVLTARRAGGVKAEARRDRAAVP
jgi:hypothetical protein